MSAAQRQYMICSFPAFLQLPGLAKPQRLQEVDGKEYVGAFFQLNFQFELYAN